MHKKISLYFFSLTLLALSFFCFFLYKNQERLLFRSSSLDHSFEFHSDYHLEEVFFDAQDGGLIHALLCKVDQPKGLVVYFHGRGINLSVCIKAFSDFLERGYNVLAMDYRTFGKSRGILSEENILSDAEMVYQYATQHFQPEDIVIYGISLGTGVAAYVASKHPSQRLILEAPYFSMIDLAAEKYFYIPKFFLNLIFKYPLRTDIWIQNVKAPVELFHGFEDELISYACSLKLVDLIKHHKEITLTTIKKGNHCNLRHSTEYQKRLDTILGK